MDATRRAAFEGYIARGYHPGSVVRVAAKNFLTYSDAVAYPGPELNIVLGPNGSGKSALTHAICLACGGAPKSIGRSDDITQFVKRNTEAESRSYCEVDILTEDSVCTIRRAINTENKSSKWTMGGKPSSQKDVKEFMKGFSIDVDNLNTFMPQDKVGSFTQQTPQGILHKTLQSIMVESADGTSRSLADEQTELAAHQTSTRTTENELNAKQSRVQMLTTEIQSMEAGVQRMRQRTELKELFNLYKIKMAVVEAVACEESVKQKQTEVDEATNRLNAAQERIQPLDTKVRDLKRRLAVQEKQVQGSVKQLDKNEAAISALQDDVEQCSVRMETTVLALDSLASSRRHLEIRLADVNAEVARIAQLKGEAEEKHPEHLERFKSIQEELQKVDNENSEGNNKLNEISMQCQNKLDEIQSVEREIKNQTDKKQNFLRKVGRFRDVPKVYDWIQKNRHRFRGEVLGPVGMYIDVDSVEIARMLESSIVEKRLMSFLTELDEDAQLLNMELRTQGLKATICTIKNNENMPGPFSKSQLRDFGTACDGNVRYVIDDVPSPTHMPVMVRSFLQSFCSLHKVIYLKPDPSSTTDVSKLPASKFDIFCAQEKKFMMFTVERDGNITKVAGTKSRYHRSAPVTLVTTDAKVNKYLSVGDFDREGKLTNLKSHHERLVGDMRALEGARAEIQRRQQELLRQSQDIRQQRSLCQNELKMVQQYSRQLESETRRAAELTNQLSKSAESEKEGLKATLRQEIKNYEASLTSLNKKVKNGFSLAVSNAVFAQGYRIIRAECSSTELELRTAQDGLADFERLKLIAEQERDEKQRELEDLERMLQELQKESGGAKKFEKLYAKCLEMCPEETYHDIEIKMTEINAILERSVENSNLLEKYDETKRNLATEEGLLVELRKRLQKSEEAIGERLRLWHKNVKTLADKLNVLFNKFMSELKYYGEIKVREIGGIDTYEMQMLVSFRGESDIAPLSGQRHSGGERAVATIMYLMALQGLTSAPFRVVDEINQGMDERNERLVFDIIVRNSCISKEERQMNPTARKPQYFLVSPKLLQGLRAMEADGVTVLMVWNGPGVIPFQVGDYVKSLRQQKRGRDEDAEEELNDDIAQSSNDLVSSKHRRAS